MKKLITIILIVLFLVSGCGLVDGEYMSESRSPELSSSPVNGVWKVEEIIKSESREPFKEGDLFYFNIDFFAAGAKIYVGPDFEITTVNKNAYLADRMINSDILETAKENLSVVTISYNNQPVAEIIPIKDDKIFSYIDNQFLSLKLERPSITKEEKSEIMGIWTERAKNTFNNASWGAVLGIKSVVYDEMNNIPGYKYQTVIFKSRDGVITTEKIDGIYIKDGTESYIYQVKRALDDGIVKDEIYLNDKKLKLAEGEKLPSNIFSINFLSENYLTIESHYLDEEKLSDLSTYSTRYKSGLRRLNSDDIVDFSSDKLYDLTRQKDVLSTTREAKSSIGIFRENGFYVLKSRVVAFEKGRKYNRDISLSVNFPNANNLRISEKAFQNISKNFHGLKDAFSTPDGRHIFLVTPESISIYGLRNDKISNDPEYKIPLDKNSSLISFGFLNAQELEEIYDDLKPVGLK